MGVRRINVELLVGAAEAAAILGLSVTRISQLLLDDPTFPEPVHRVRATPLWLEPELENWKATRVKNQGRRGVRRGPMAPRKKKVEPDT